MQIDPGQNRLTHVRHNRQYHRFFLPMIALMVTLVVLLSFAVPSTVLAATEPENSESTNHESTHTSHPAAYAIATAHPLATQAGDNLLSQQAGNAFDAAVAISAALGVVEPSGSGFGGGGFWLLYIAAEDRYVMLDGRETAPLAANRDMYLDADGQPIPRQSKDGPLAAGIPGMPAALAHLAEHYGQLPLATSLQDAIRYARDGFPMDNHLLQRLLYRNDALNEASRNIYFPDGQIPTAGTRIKQTDLANTLDRFASSNGIDFYRGETAQRLVSGVQAAGGIWQLDDLAQYAVIEREPIFGRYREHTLVSAAPPSSGGIVLLQTLNTLEHLPYKNSNPTQQLHYRIEALRRSYRDRAAYLGDTDFVEVPLASLGHDFYAAGLGLGIPPTQATPSAHLPAVSGEHSQGTDTTHFAVVDQYGNRVAATLSINLPFGSGFTVPGTGILLNNEMDDFSIKPGVPNAYGLVGNEANAIQPGKRMLSSMSPTFLESPNGDFAVLGSPGGSRIITMVLQGILGYENRQNAQQIVTAPRIHHQYLPDVVSYEPNAIDAETLATLERYGHTFKLRQRPWGNMQVILQRGGQLSAASDPRGIGTSVVQPTQGSSD